ncbi:MAG: PAS domain S-box protein [Chloroflexi bacterium]|nr:PAS domain S-box protein [Chloroflexota bacterium]
MSQLRSLLLIGLVVSAGLAVLYFASQSILGGSYTRLEQESVQRDLARVVDALQNDLDQMNSKDGDWSNWDDAYVFAEDQNEEFIKVNMTDLALVQLRINVMLFLSPAGNLVYSKAIDLEQKSDAPLPAGLAPLLADKNFLATVLQNKNPDSSLTGFILLRDHPLLIAARPIVTSEGKGPIHGTLVFGRYLDRAHIAQLGSTTHLSVSAQRLDVGALDAGFEIARQNLSDAQPYFIQTTGENAIEGYTRWKDVAGNPNLALRIDQPRDIYQQGQLTIRYFMLSTILIAALGSLVMQILLNRLVLSRRGQRESEARYRAVIEQAAEGIFIFDAQSLRVLEANAASRKLAGYAPAEILQLRLPDLIEEDAARHADIQHQILTTRAVDFGAGNLRRQDGTTRAIEASASVITFGGREVIAAVVRDVTERTRAEAERARLFEQEQSRRAELDALYSLSRALSDAADFEAMLELVPAEAVRRIHTTFACILNIEQDELVIRSTFPVRTLSRDLGKVERAPLTDLPTCQRVLRSATPLLLQHMDASISAHERELLYLDLAHTLLAIPLRVEERVIGILTLGEARHPAREQFTDEKISLANSIAEQTAGALRRAELYSELEHSYLQTVLALASAVDAKDTYTHDHAERLAVMASAIGAELEMSRRDLEDLHYGAILHDIGKIGVADAILQKPARLNADEWVKMREHPGIGAQILAPVPRLAGAAKIVRHHHERWDGKGYPDHLAGENIPLGARILTVADSFSAITDARVYKKARAVEEAVAELKKHAGVQFDPRVVEIFLRLLERGKIGGSEHSEGVSVSTK